MAKKRSADIHSSQFPVVGIGASAGGITALQSLFKDIPAHPSLSFVIVQHLLPDQPSQLAKLMGKWAALSVHEAKGGVSLERDCIYVAPAGEELRLEHGVFVTRPLDGASARAGIDTIDSFFESLASDVGHRAIAVVLSGTGTDGAAGAVRIKQAGGMVLVQDPTSAMHDGMPNAAIANGAADHIMPLGALAQELVACASPSYMRSASAASWAGDVTAVLESIIKLIRNRAGFDLAGYKTTPLLWRIQRRMEFRRVPLFRDYEALLHDDSAELESLIRGIPIHVTDFFRDAPAWALLQREVIPRLFAQAKGALVRVWTPACATGQEAYSLAMLLAEHASTLTEPSDFQVFATDAAAEIVARAGRGIFKPAAMSALSAERRQRFFYAADGTYRVKRALREKMVFAPQDLLADPPFSGLDLVTCRNLLIYLEPDAVKRVVYLLHSALHPGGYLFLGKGEALAAKQRGFAELLPSSRIYRKTGRATKVDVEFPRRPVRLRTSRSLRSAVEAHSHEAAIESSDLPAVLVDRYFQIVRIYGDTGPFLRLKPGEPTLNLLQLVLPPLGVEIELAAQKARAQLCAVVVDGLSDPTMRACTLSLRVTPLHTPEEDGSRLLVSFLSSAAAGNGEADEPSMMPGARAGEAVDYSEALRLSHEELEASREELQALTQELRASNDQLNLANDELNQANTRLRDKLDELETQSNVLSSGAVMTLFLDEELCVRWFTAALSELFPVKAWDAGRRITDFAPKFSRPEFIEDVRAVMRTGVPKEAAVRTFDDRWYLKRIRPFRAGSGEGSGAGVAITFTDITDRKNAEEALRETEARQAFLLKLSDALRFLADAAEIRAAGCRLLGEHLGASRVYYVEYEPKEDCGVVADDYLVAGLPSLAGRYPFAAFRSTYERIANGVTWVVADVGADTELAAREREFYAAQGVIAWVDVPLAKNGTLEAALCTVQTAARRWTAHEIGLVEDVAERLWSAVQRGRTEAALRRSEARFAQFAASSSDALWIRDAETLTMEYGSPAMRSVYGIAPEALLGDVKRWAALIVPDDRDAALGHLAKARECEAVVHEFRIQRPTDGSFRWIRNTDFPLLDEHGRVQRIGGIAQDVTEAKLAVEHKSVLLAELQHRVRSIMATVRSIAARTADGAASVQEYAERMAGRLLTLARVQTLLTRAANAGVNIATIVHEELAAQTRSAGRYTITGPAVTLSPKAAEVLTLVLHELTINALKYGALSAAAGHITVTWSIAEKPGIPWLRFDWQERGAPGRVQAVPSAPRRRGFGSELIEGRLPYELGGSGRVRIGSGGAQCHIEFPLQEGASVLETNAPKRAAVFGGSLDMRGEADLAGRRILVAEDDYFLATDLARTLRSAGAEVLGPCSTEDAALDELAQGAPVAAIVDLKLGAGPSFKLAARLRRDGIPFVFITGYDEIMPAPDFAHVPRLHKPVELKQIIHALTGVLAPAGPRLRPLDPETLAQLAALLEAGKGAKGPAK